MNIIGWKYYNHAAIPSTLPHEVPDLAPIRNGNIWKIKGGIPLLVRWTEDFDCEQETEWWYVIKDTSFDILELKAKRRYEIRKGEKYFTVRRIDPVEYKDELYEVQVAAFSAYPEKYRPEVEKVSFWATVDSWKEYIVYGAFDKETGVLRGYALLKEHDNVVEFNVLKTNPIYEKMAINAAIVAKIIENYNERLDQGKFYICDGSRAILHETAFQDYLEKYFMFRKAYCNLEIKYRFPLNFFVKLVFPFRKLIGRKNKLAGQLTGILMMEEIHRSCKRKRN